MIWKKFDGYWQKGKPYLDGIKVVYIPDPVTASAMMQAGEADIWVTGHQARDQKQLESMGFVRNAYWTGLNFILTPNTKDPDRPTYNKKVKIAEVADFDHEATLAKTVSLLQSCYKLTEEDLVRKLSAIVPEYNTSNSKYIPHQISETGNDQDSVKLEIYPD